MRFEVRNGVNKYHLIPYVGNKSRFSHIFDVLMPDSIEDKEMVDVFGGSGAVTIYMCDRYGASPRIAYNDVNTVLSNFISVVRRDPESLIKLYQKHRERHSQKYYTAMREKNLTGYPATEAEECAGRFLYLAKNAFSGKIRFNKKGKFNSPMRKGSKCPKLDKKRLLWISDTIWDINPCNTDYTAWRDVEDYFLYLDPPYIGNNNGHYGGTVPDREKFAEFVNHISKKNMVMLSEQNTAEQLGLSDEFRTHEVMLRRSLQYVTKHDSKEYIYVNYDV